MTKKSEQQIQMQLYGRELDLPKLVGEELPAISLLHLIAENVQHFKQAPDSFVREVAEQMDIITGFHLTKDGDGLHLDIYRQGNYRSIEKSAE